MNTSNKITSAQQDSPSFDMAALEEARVVAKAADGDQAAVEILWKRYHAVLFRFFRANVHNRDEAEDLASDTMISIIRNIHRFRGKSNSACGTPARGCTFKTYVMAAANLKLKYWLRQKLNRDKANSGLRSDSLTPGQEAATCLATEQPLKAMMTESADPLQQLMRQDQLDSTHYALADLGLRSCEQFKAMIFHYGCGLPHRDIAQLLDTRKETINARLQEGRMALRSRQAYV
jgi:RNA polymerase sigma factor (sigma-70 family)